MSLCETLQVFAEAGIDISPNRDDADDVRRVRPMVAWCPIRPVNEEQSGGVSVVNIYQDGTAGSYNWESDDPDEIRERLDGMESYAVLDDPMLGKRLDDFTDLEQLAEGEHD